MIGTFQFTEKLVLLAWGRCRHHAIEYTLWNSCPHECMSCLCRYGRCTHVEDLNTLIQPDSKVCQSTECRLRHEMAIGSGTAKEFLVALLMKWEEANVGSYQDRKSEYMYEFQGQFDV